MNKLKCIITAITLSLFLYSCSSNKTESKSDTTATNEGAKTEVKTDSDKSAPAAIEITKKDTAKAKNFIFLVKNITEPTIHSWSVTKPEDNQKYIAVQIWLKNTSKEDVSLTRDDFKLLDQDDAEFVEVTDFTEHRKPPILFLKEYDAVVLKPNQAKSGWVTFTTSKNSKASKIQYDNITVKL